MQYLNSTPTTSTTTLKKIISGGQTGADRGGLEAGEALGLETGGWATAGFWTVEGKKPELGTRFGLLELIGASESNVASMYVARSMANVDSSDGTIAIRLYESVGTDKTIGYCRSEKWKVVKAGASNHRPILVIDNVAYANMDCNIANIRAFIDAHGIKTLNICGHRETKVCGISLATIVKQLLINAINEQASK